MPPASAGRSGSGLAGLGRAAYATSRGEGSGPAVAPGVRTSPQR